jgi:thioredoxin reductase (NADPH)
VEWSPEPDYLLLMTQSPQHPVDLLVVGAGPCGIAAAVAAQRAGLNAIVVDRGCIAQSIVDYPTYMTFFSTADRLEIGGVPFPVPSSRPTRLEALTYYRGVVRYFGVRVRPYEEVTGIDGEWGDFRVSTLRRDGTTDTLRARAVVLALGGFHAPNALGVKGEELPHVFHHYREPHPYHDQDVLVVGGANSAVEAALELWRAGARVTLVHFKDTLDRGVKPWIRPDIENRIAKGEVAVRWLSRVCEIRPGSVLVRDETTGAVDELGCQWVFALTGWRPDHGFLTSVGVEIEPTTGVPVHNPATLETTVQGVYIAGVIAAGLDANRIFIENGREHGALIVNDLLTRSLTRGGAGS